MKPKFNNRYQGLEFRICLVRENTKPSKEIEISNAEDVYSIVKEELTSADREIFLSILLTTKNTVIGVETVCVGTLNSTIITPREVFKSAILANAASIIVCHNHPSGNLTPSNEDLKLTKCLSQAGELLQINLLDHLIVSYQGYKSLKHEI